MEDSLYREVLLDHYWNPRNHGTLPHPDASAEEDNPLCGDRVRLDLAFSNEKISDVRFTGTGCAISQAATSMLTENLAGMKTADAKKLTEKEMLNILSVNISPARLKCALLGWKALQRAISQHHIP